MIARFNTQQTTAIVIMPPAARTKKHAAGGTSKTNKSRTNAGASKRTRALDTSLDGVEPLNISWQLGSDAGMYVLSSFLPNLSAAKAIYRAHLACVPSRW